jgi:hypothetical protein
MMLPYSHLQAVVLADVRVVPVEAVIREAEPVDELAADGDGCLGLLWHAVVRVVDSQPVPVHCGVVVAVVAHPHRDLGSLSDAQGRSGDGAVVGKHANGGIAELVDDRSNAQLVRVIVTELDDVGGPACWQAVDVGREEAIVDVVGCHAAPPRARRSGRRSSGTAMGEKALTLAPPVFPTG